MARLKKGQHKHVKPRKCPYPPLKDVADVPNMASKIRNADTLGHPLYVPPRRVTDDSDVEGVLCDTLEAMAMVMTESARHMREVLDRRYVSVDDAVEMAKMSGKPRYRRARVDVNPVDVEKVRAKFFRLVSMNYDRAVALLDVYSAMHFNEIKEVDMKNFEKSITEELIKYE